MGLIIKNGIVYNGAESEPVVYSLDEREIGVWTDGKPLYQKTYSFTATGNTITTIADVSFIDTLVKIDGVIANRVNAHELTRGASGGANQGFPRIDSGSLKYYAGSGSDFIAGTGYVTLQYTKTADTPGSGTWTPSGVKTVHYNENEQVIGTWIDGSTLYERTLYKDLSGQAEHWYVYLDTLIDDINNYTIINFQGQLQFKEGSYIYAHVVPNAGSSYYINRNSGRWYLYFHSGNATCTWGYMTATIRYVKKILGQPSS